MLVSVVIPSYNHKDYVIQAIESVLNQGWPEIDLIVIDDGSTDGSTELILKYHEEHGGFRFVARENRGLIKTLNEGLRLARGDFFCELASDDFFPHASIEKRANFLFEHPEYVAVFGNGLVVEGETLTDHTFMDEKRRRMFAQADPIPDMLNGALPVFSTGFIRKEVLLKVGGFDEENFRYYEDLDTPIRLSLAGKLGYLDAPVICRRTHDTNVSGTTHHIRTEKVICYTKLLKIHGMAPYKRLLNKRLRRSFLALGRCLNEAGGGTPREVELFTKAWPLFWSEFRLLGYLFKYGRGK